MLISQKIEQMIRYTQDAQKNIGEFLLSEKQRLSDYTMQEIADATFSSKPTLVRIAKKLGFSGWNDLMAAYKEEVRYMATHKNDADVNQPFTSEESPLEIAGKIGAVNQESIQETLQLLDQDALEQAVEILLKARRICIFGISINYFMGELFQHKMILIGRPVEIIAQAEQRFQAESMIRKDCAILISYSGNEKGRNPTSVIPNLEKHQVPIIGITSMGDNLLRQHADCTLTIASREKLYSKIGSFATETSIMFLLDMLYACYFAKNYDRNMEYRVSLSRSVEQNRYSTAQGIMEESGKI